MRDVAAQTGLSIATVSRVINGAPARRRPDPRAGTRQPVDLLGPARPQSAVVVTTATRAGPVVFVRCPYQLTDYFGLIVSAIADDARRRTAAI